MKKIILGLLLLFLFYGTILVGFLTWRIIQENGNPVAKAKIVIEGKEMTTDEFGGYKIDLRDGQRELSRVIDSASYTSEKIKVFFPEVKQN